MTKKLRAFDKRFNNSVDIYFDGEQPGDSQDPRCSQAEDEYIDWKDQYTTWQDNGNDATAIVDATDEECIDQIQYILERLFPGINDFEIQIMHQEP